MKRRGRPRVSPRSRITPEQTADLLQIAGKTAKKGKRSSLGLIKELRFSRR
jgi:hypothetical protein